MFVVVLLCLFFFSLFLIFLIYVVFASAVFGLCYCLLLPSTSYLYNTDLAVINYFSALCVALLLDFLGFWDVGVMLLSDFKQSILGFQFVSRKSFFVCLV